jgi:hypothetical protein
MSGKYKKLAADGKKGLSYGLLTDAEFLIQRKIGPSHRY